MNARKLKQIIAEGESTVLEFKRKAVNPQKIAKEITALINTKGGILLIGVDDDGTIYGVKSEKSEIDIVETACNFWIEPPITPLFEIVGIYDKDIVVCHLEQGLIKPYKARIEDADGKISFKAYIRVGEKSIEASKEMTRLLKHQSDKNDILKLSIGNNEKRLFEYLEKYERATVKDFSKLVNISKRRAEGLLIRLVRAGVLLIHNDETHDYFSLTDPK